MERELVLSRHVPIDYSVPNSQTIVAIKRVADTAINLFPSIPSEPSPKPWISILTFVRTDLPKTLTFVLIKSNSKLLFRNQKGNSFQQIKTIFTITPDAY
ncbi:hypothetical protein H5410_007539 [Solanum commersonii]|uniref:Uncharacterized protein n=1 Tax=Solanum commersonii TaxID=4109 RepID=A0A9J6ACZ1_SOLCO|nr:hypothetical protein H5410_007539 [Solanum commersonii]